MKKVLLVVALGAMVLGQVQAQSEKSGANMSQGASLMDSPQSMLRAAEDSWLDYAADSYAGGTGTEADPYLIETPEQLVKLCLEATGEEGGSFETNLLLKGVYFKQTADIDLSAHSVRMVAIGLNGSFAGNYDGGGFKITGYHYDMGTMSDLRENLSLGGSLFLNVRQATIKNVVVEDFSITANYTNANTVGYTAGFLASFVHDSKIENCVVSGSASFSIAGKANNLRFAGIAGYANNSEIRNCHASGTIALSAEVVNDPENQYGDYVQAAGIAAEGDGEMLISDCTSGVQVQTEGKGTSNPGVIVRSAGIAAWVNNAQLLNCANTGTISAKSANTVANASWVQAAGLIACINQTANAENCWNAAKVSSEGGFDNQPADPFACFKGERFSTRNCSYDKDLMTVEGEGHPQAYETAFMQSEEFVNMLNQYRPEGCLEWRAVEGGYPVIAEPEPVGPPTAVETVEAAKASFYTRDGGVVITTQEPTSVAVYTFQGVTRTSCLVPSGTTTIALPEGLYILKLGDESHKIRVAQ